MSFNITESIRLGEELVVLGGPCVAESPEICFQIAEFMMKTCEKLGIKYIFKASFDKANRSSVEAYRGPGLEDGLKLLMDIKEKLGVALVTDVHETYQMKAVGEIVDIVQIPAFLCRQTDLLVAAGETGKTINVKKGQFVAPEDMKNVIGKIRSTGNNKIMLTERGTTFGYHNMVVDMRGLATMKSLGYPICFDATHSVQLPGGNGTCSGGDRRFIGPLSRAAAAVGIDAIFMEVHPDPDNALCDGPNSLDFAGAEKVLKNVKAIYDLGLEG